MANKRVYKAFVSGEFHNQGRVYGFASKSERDDFIKEIAGARAYGFIDLTPRQFRQWQASGFWDHADLTTHADACKGLYKFIEEGSLLRPGLDNWWPLYRRKDGSLDTRWGCTPDPLGEEA